MSVSIKSKREIEIMREAGKILGTVMRDLSKEVKAGMSTYTLDKIGEEMIRSYGCIPYVKDMKVIRQHFVYQLMKQ